MRKLTSALFVCALFTACAGAYAKDVQVSVSVNNKEIKLSSPAIMRNGKAYVSLSGVAKALHATAKWDKKTQTAIVTMGNKRTRFSKSDGGIITSGDTLLLPLRAAGEAVGCTVEWDNTARAIEITTEAPCPIGGG